jgi:hypothetical protein
MMALGQSVNHRCPCGKELRHRGSCRFRRTYRTEKEKPGYDDRTAHASGNIAANKSARL